MASVFGGPNPNLNQGFNDWPRGQQVKAVLLATNTPSRPRGPLWRTAAEYAAELGGDIRTVTGILRSLEHKRLVERQFSEETPAHWASTIEAEHAIDALGVNC